MPRARGNDGNLKPGPPGCLPPAPRWPEPCVGCVRGAESEPGAEMREERRLERQGSRPDLAITHP